MNGFAVMLIAYAGFFAGVLLARFAKDEVLPGMRQFRIAATALFMTVVFFLFRSLSINLLLAFLAAALSGLLYIYLLDKRHLFLVSQAILASAFFASAEKPDFMLPVASLIFLHNLPSGTIFFARTDAKLLLQLRGALLATLSFPVIAALLLLLF